MIADPTRPLSADEARRNRRIIVAIAVVFVLVSVSVFVWGLTVTRTSREAARETDAALRSVAWAVLCYAGQNGGQFPTSDAQLRAAAASPGPAAGKPWPSTLDAAMGGLEAIPAADALGKVGVTWGSSPEVAPDLNTGGRPSSFGTVDAVNGWLAEYARDRVRAIGNEGTRNPAP
jgi:hypothetical protein